ncbi:MAG: leucine-rich repeat domain-containing protein [Tannerellaceae bacterium]|jgi:hypothetical protein|nr:leucine-rich repeat domain-containing protein [Tannerellaceae bacterium]
MKLKITFLIVCALFLGTVTGFGQIISDSGTIEGSTLTWTLTISGDDVRLTVSAPNGPDAMPDYGEVISPWREYYLSITSIVIEDGVTRIGSYAFGA